MKNILCVVTLFVLSLATLAQAQQSDQSAADANKRQYVGTVSPEATSTCTYTFQSGTANSFLKYCVTKNGNIVQFQSPSGIEYIAKSPAGEGYGFCDFDVQKQYYDYAGYGDSGNWQPSVTVSSSATSVQISRKTSDGLYTLIQTIALAPASILAQVQMTLVNNTTTAHHIGLLRYADADVENQTNNSFDYTRRTAFGYLNLGYGLSLRYSSGAILNGGFVQDIPGGPNPCQPFTHVVGPFSGDGSVMMQYDMQLPKKASSTVIVQYRSF